MTDRPREAPPVSEKLRACLSQALEAGASDLHLIVGYPPVLRLHGELTELPEPPLGAEEATRLLQSLCPAETLERLRAQKDVDFSFDLFMGQRSCRFRANLFHNGQNLGACLRVVPEAIPDLEWAGF